MPVKCEACDTSNSIDSRECRFCKKALPVGGQPAPSVGPGDEWSAFEAALLAAVEQQTREVRLQGMVLDRMARHLSFIYGVLAILTAFWVIGLVIGVLSMLSSSS